MLKNLLERLLYYWAKTYIEGFRKGEFYTKLEKTIAILISAENLNITKEIERYHTKWEIREKEESDK